MNVLLDVYSLVDIWSMGVFYRSTYGVCVSIYRLTYGVWVSIYRLTYGVWVYCCTLYFVVSCLSTMTTFRTFTRKYKYDIASFNCPHPCLIANTVHTVLVLTLRSSGHDITSILHFMNLLKLNYSKMLRDSVFRFVEMEL